MPKNSSTTVKGDGFEFKLYRPDEIKDYLDQYIIGQDDAKKTLSVAVYNHYKRILHNANNPPSENTVTIDKSNVICLGPTGSAKTYMVKKISELIGTPSVVINTCSITQSGFVGDDVESCIVGLLRASDYNLAATQMGIVILDEVDKIAKRDAGPSITRDVGGEGVQQGLLKMVEGMTVGVPPSGGRKHPEQPLLYVDTTNILFIGVGAFCGLEDIVRKRMGTNKIGFTVEKRVDDENTNFIEMVNQEDLRNFGMIPEFVGRFPIITHVNKLDRGALVKILSEPKNSLVKQYTQLLSMDGIKLEFSSDALGEIADIAYGMETGARGLRSVMEKVMEDIMFSAPRLSTEGVKRINITKEMVVDKYSTAAYKKAC